MTRRTLNPDGSLTLKSFSCFGPEEHAGEAFQQELAQIDEHNRKALAEWDGLTPEQQQRRTREFEEAELRSQAKGSAETLPRHPQSEQGELPTFL